MSLLEKRDPVLGVGAENRDSRTVPALLFAAGNSVLLLPNRVGFAFAPLAFALPANRDTLVLVAEWFEKRFVLSLFEKRDGLSVRPASRSRLNALSVPLPKLFGRLPPPLLPNGRRSLPLLRLNELPPFERLLPL